MNYYRKMQRGGKKNSSEFYLHDQEWHKIYIYKYTDAASDVFFMQQ